MKQRKLKRKELSTPEKIDLFKGIFQIILFVVGFIGFLFLINNCHF